MQAEGAAARVNEDVFVTMITAAHTCDMVATGRREEHRPTIVQCVLSASPAHEGFSRA